MVSEFCTNSLAHSLVSGAPCRLGANWFSNRAAFLSLQVGKLYSLQTRSLVVFQLLGQRKS